MTDADIIAALARIAKSVDERDDLDAAIGAELKLAYRAAQEDCAKVCEKKAEEWHTPVAIAHDSAMQCAAAIRAMT